MTNEQLIVKYNPANSGNLKPEDYTEMRALSDDQISVLAEAYPNLPARKSYLRLYDTNLQPHKQLYQLSTWQNLRNVRKYSNKKNLIAYDFYVPGARAAARQATKPVKTTPQKVVVDLTAQEAADELRKSFEKKPLVMAKDIKPAQKVKPILRPMGKVQADQEFDDATK